MFSVKKYYNDLKKQFANSDPSFCEASVTPFIQSELNKLLEHIDQKDIESSLSELMEQFIKIELKPERMSQQDRSLIKLETFNKMPINERINILIDIVIRIKNIDPSLRMIIDDQDIKCDFHQQNIIKQLPHPDIKITEYDEEIYKMTRSIGKYKAYFTSQYELGHFKFVGKRRYKYDSSFIHEDSQYYYSRYFGIDINDKSYQTTNKINNIVIEYIKGLFWVFNYYMNNFDTTKIDNWHWYYQYSHAPLLFHIVKYISIMFRLNKDKRDKWQWMDQLYSSIVTSNNDSKIMSGKEYYLYMNSHQSSLNKFDEELLGKDINDKYKSLDHKKLFGDFDSIIDNVWNGNNKYLDARNTYLSRAKLSNINILNYDSWKKILSENNIYFNNNQKEEKTLSYETRVTNINNISTNYPKQKYIIVQKDKLSNHNNHKIDVDTFINIAPSVIKIETDNTTKINTNINTNTINDNNNNSNTISSSI
jgi:5'-3' exonuclease